MVIEFDGGVMRGEEERLTSVFAALADPTRRAILERLTAGDESVAELARPFAMSQPAVSKHLRVLERAGLITRTPVATARLSHLEARPLQEATEYMARYRRFWTESFDRLDVALAAYLIEHPDERTRARPTDEPTEPHSTDPHSTDPHSTDPQRNNDDD